jgi:hypothetical protein
VGTAAALFLLVVLVAGGIAGAVSSNAEAKTAGRCTRTISGGLEAALKAATGGQVICLRSGDYRYLVEEVPL